MLRTVRGLLIAVSTVSFSSIAHAQIVVPGADGSDGPLFVPAGTNLQIDLGEAAAGPNITWTTASPVAGKGVYDPSEWAVVYKYSSVDIQANATLTFKNHPSNPPVVWLVSGNVTIAPGAIVSIRGRHYNEHGTPLPSKSHVAGGPGGFGGGGSHKSIFEPHGTGYGPGGGASIDSSSGYSGAGTSGSYSTVPTYFGYTAGNPGPKYGGPECIPLIGGSGGAGTSWAFNSTSPSTGAGGGGAMMIACSGNLLLDGVIDATGGNGIATATYAHGTWGAAGSGGAVRLIAGHLIGGGTLKATGGIDMGNAAIELGGLGRIRIETPVGGYSASILSNPTASISTTIGPIFPPATQPKVWISAIDSVAAPADPTASVEPFEQDLEIQAGAGKVITILGQNVPANWVVKLRLIRAHGMHTDVTAAPAGPNTYTATVDIPQGVATLQARAYDPSQY